VTQWAMPFSLAINMSTLIDNQDVLLDFSLRIIGVTYALAALAVKKTFNMWKSDRRS